MKGTGCLALILEVIYELGVLPIFPCQGFFELKHGSVDGNRSMALKNRSYSSKSPLPYSHLVRHEVPRALCNLWLFGLCTSLGILLKLLQLSCQAVAQGVQKTLQILKDSARGTLIAALITNLKNDQGGTTRVASF